MSRLLPASSSVYLALLLGSISDPTSFSAEPDETSSPAPQIWDLESLSPPPKFSWVDEESPIRSLLYEGEPLRGEPTEVFAFYASPLTLGKDPPSENPKKSFPAVVLVHGGGGTAFAEWVELWANRGYAAIAMDLSGHRPPAPTFHPDSGKRVSPAKGGNRGSRTRLEKGGLDQGHPEKFGSIGGDVSDDWPLHAVANVIRAHSLIRSFPEVDPERTAITGISWGGYTTCLVASVDHRFRAAVPVYGCGFLYEGESVQKKSIDALEPDLRSEWIRRYDPSRHLPQCRVPILFVNGTHDIHYPLDSYQRSFDLVPGEKSIRIEPRMRHSHPAGWAPREIGDFIDQHCRDGMPLPEIGNPEVGADGKGQLSILNQVPIASATLHFTEEEGLRSKRKWTAQEAEVRSDSLHFSAPPNTANTWFLTVTDREGRLLSTSIQFEDDEAPGTRAEVGVPAQN